MLGDTGSNLIGALIGVRAGDDALGATGPLDRPRPLIALYALRGVSLDLRGDRASSAPALD